MPGTRSRNHVEDSQILAYRQNRESRHDCIKGIIKRTRHAHMKAAEAKHVSHQTNFTRQARAPHSAGGNAEDGGGAPKRNP